MERIPEGTLVVVADGESARLFRSVGKGNVVSLRQMSLLEVQNVNDEGPSGVLPAEQTGQQINEATFAKQLAHQLNHAALTNQFEHLVLIADPQTLGQMRPQLHKQVMQRMHAEVAKTLTNAPLEDVERALS